MNRIAFLASLIGLGGLVAKAQDSEFIAFRAPAYRPKLNVDDTGQISIEGRGLDWINKGMPTNNQCPLCGTMAETYVNPPLCYNGTDTLAPCAPKERVTRCKACNNAFFQDSK